MAGIGAKSDRLLGETVPVCDWLNLAPALRHGAHWNVLEEVLYQGLSQRVRTQDTRYNCLPHTNELMDRKIP